MLGGNSTAIRCEKLALQFAMPRIPFICPKCGFDIELRVWQVPKSLNDLVGAPCAQCRLPLTEGEVKQQALKIAENEIAKAFKDWQTAALSTEQRIRG